MPFFTYTVPLPVGANNPSTDRPNMTVNNASINSILGAASGVDMIGFNDNNGGYHNKITYVAQSVIPTAVTGANVEYCKLSTESIQEQYLERPTGDPIQLTRGNAGTNSNGSYSFLPGGFLIQWGVIQASSHLATVTFPVPFTSAPTSVTATVRALAGNYFIASVQPPSNTGVVINESNGSQFIYWMAIGV